MRKLRSFQALLALCLPLAPISDPAIAETVVEGSAAIVAGDIAGAREQAIRRALARATEAHGASINANATVRQDAVFESIQVRSNACTEGTEQLWEKREGDELKVAIKVTVRDEGTCTATCNTNYANRILVTSFAMEFPEQKLRNEPVVLSEFTAVELAKKIGQGQRLLGDFNSKSFPYPSPARAPEPYMTHSGADSEIPLQAKNFRAQYVLSGVYRDFGFQGGWGGASGRRIEIEAFLHDGVDGALLARKSFSTVASGQVLLRGSPSVGSHAFYRSDIGKPWGKLLDNIARWTENQAACLPFSARILRVEGARLHIDAGAEAGLTIGDTLKIHTWKQPPVTGLNGATLGMEKKIQATATIRSVYPRFSVIEIENAPSGISIREGDVIFTM